MFGRFSKRRKRREASPPCTAGAAKTSGDQPRAPRWVKLGVLLDVYRAAPDLPAADVIADLTYWQLVALQQADSEDVALLNACLEIEAELRRRGSDAAERLGALVAAGEGAWDDRVRALPDAEAARALGAVIDLGWLGQ